MELFLGVDGGGTGCRAAVCDASGRILGRAQGGPANIATDTETARSNILQAARAALPVGAELGEVRAVMGLAGANIARSVERFRDGLPFRSLRVETDALIAVKGALAGSDGIVASLGTGSVYAVQRSGAVRQAGGWGLVLGDEASGGWIARSMLVRCLHAVDGLEPATPLTAALLAEFGGPDALVAFAKDAQPVDFAALAPRVVDADDPAAREVMDRADSWVVRAIDRLQQGGALPVVFLGGLGPVFAARLQGRWPVAESRGTALEGALWLARQGL